jgi:TRAP-type C4-dicarboxylate transport system permease small subunit
MVTGKHIPLLPLRIFVRKVICNLVVGLVIIALSLLLGITGYRYFAGMSWVDAYENAAMILSGMGPVDTLTSDRAKIFAGTYALFSGIVFLVVIAIIIAPIFQRFLHKFLIKTSK